jgi:hypothetical protein
MSNENQPNSFGPLFSDVEGNQPLRDANGQAAIDRTMSEARKKRQEEVTRLLERKSLKEQERKADEYHGRHSSPEAVSKKRMKGQLSYHK